MLWSFAHLSGFGYYILWIYLWVNDMATWGVCYISAVMFYCWKLYACQLRIIWRRDVYFLNIYYIREIYRFNRSRALQHVIITPNLNHSLSSRNLHAKLTIDSKITSTCSSDGNQKFISLLAKDEIVWLECIHQYTTPHNNMIRVHTQSHARLHITIRLKSF